MESIKALMQGSISKFPNLSRSGLKLVKYLISLLKFSVLFSWEL